MSEIKTLLLFEEEEIGKIEKKSESQNGCVMKLGFNSNLKMLPLPRQCTRRYSSTEPLLHICA
jgi:hypothetical protein